VPSHVSQHLLNGRLFYVKIAVNCAVLCDICPYSASLPSYRSAAGLPVTPCRLPTTFQPPRGDPFGHPAAGCHGRAFGQPSPQPTETPTAGQGGCFAATPSRRIRCSHGFGRAHKTPPPRLVWQDLPGHSRSLTARARQVYKAGPGKGQATRTFLPKAGDCEPSPTGF